MQGEYIVDSGHLVAYEPTLQLRLGMAAGIFSASSAGRAGDAHPRPGAHLHASRSMQGLASWVNTHLYEVFRACEILARPAASVAKLHVGVARPWCAKWAR